MSIKVGDFVAVSTWADGIAFHVDRPHVEDLYYPDQDEYESVTVAGVWDCHMVGDDRTFVIDEEDMTIIDEDEFCRSCGQIECGHG